MKTKTSTYSHKDLPPFIFQSEEDDTKIELFADDVKLSRKHALVEHKYVDSSASYVENMGKDSRKISMTCAFFAGIKTSFNEPLYPDQYNKFIKICEKSNKAPGTLFHPDANIRCYVSAYSTVLSSAYQDGVKVSVDFIESSLGDFQLEEDDLISTGLTKLLFDAEALDLAMMKMKMKLQIQMEKMDNLLKRKLGIDAFVNSIIKYVDMVKLTRDRVIGRFDNILNSLTRLRDSVKRLVDQVKLDLKVAADVLDAAKKLFDNVVITKAKIEKVVYKYYVTNSACSLTTLAKLVKHSPDFILLHNPKLAKTPLISKDTVIKYPRY